MCPSFDKKKRFYVPQSLIPHIIRLRDLRFMGLINSTIIRLRSSELFISAKFEMVLGLRPQSLQALYYITTIPETKADYSISQAFLENSRLGPELIASSLTRFADAFPAVTLLIGWLAELLLVLGNVPTGLWTDGISSTSPLLDFHIAILNQGIADFICCQSRRSDVRASRINILPTI